MRQAYDFKAALPLFCLLLAGGCATTSSADLSADDIQSRVSASCAQDRVAELELGRLFQGIKAQGFSGAALLMEGDEVLFCQAAGEAAHGKAYRSSVPADVGSIAKPVTALALLALSERGVLNLDDPLSKWLSDVPADKAAITLRQIMLHQSGLSEYVAGTEDYTRISQADVLRTILATPLQFAPGSSWAYSNAGYNLLAVVVERAAKRPYFDAIETLVLAPAGVSASFDPSAFPVVADVQKKGTWTDLRQTAAATNGPFWTLWGAGGLYMSAENLALLMRAFMDGKIVSPAAVVEAAKPAVPLDERNAGGLAFGLVKRDDRWVYYFNGMGESGSADLWGDPRTRRVLAITANSAKPHAIAAGRALAKAGLASPSPR